MGYKDRLPTQEEENNSIIRYCGYDHARINILAELDPSKISEMNSKGWLMDFNSSNIEELIKDFVNIYGKIYSDGKRGGNALLYRGTTNKEAKNTTKGKEISKALSTSVNLDVAKTFCEYGNAAIERISIKNGLPYIYTEEYKDGQNEEEILILPFSRVTGSKFTSKWNEIKYYDIGLEKGELPEIEESEINRLKEQAINGLDKFFYKSKVYARLKEEIEWVSEKINIPGLDREDLRYLVKRQNEIYGEIALISEDINQYRENFLKMLKGLCKQREKDKDMEKEERRQEMIKLEEEKRIKQEQEKLKKLSEEIESISGKISNYMKGMQKELLDNMNELKRNIEWFTRVSKDLEINCFNNKSIEEELVSKFNQTIEEIRKRENESKEDKQESKDEEYAKVKDYENTVEEVKRMIGQLSDLSKSYDSESENELKSNLNKKVNELIYKSEYHSLQEKRESISEEKETIFQKLFKRNDLKDAKLRNIDAKMRLSFYERQVRNPENSIENMLQGIYDCAYKHYGGNLTDDMRNTVESIVENLRVSMTEGELIEQAKANSNTGTLLVVKNKKPSRIFGIFNKKEIQIIEQDTIQVQNKETIARRHASDKNVFEEGSKLHRKYFEIQNTLSNIRKQIRIENNDMDVRQEDKEYDS